MYIIYYTSSEFRLSSFVSDSKIYISQSVYLENIVGRKLLCVLQYQISIRSFLKTYFVYGEQRN